MKKIIRIVLVLLVAFLAVRFCANKFGSVIPLPGGSAEETTSETGGWFPQKEKTRDKTANESASSDEIKDLEKELGIGTEKGETPTVKIPSTTSSVSPLSFKGIPMTGSLSSFGAELVKVGFRKAGDGSYTGDFAGYSGCKITPSGSPVQAVRVDFPVISDWDALEKAYDSLQASLTQKYGKEPKTAANSNLAVYDLPNGTISLDADVTDRASWHVVLTYANEAAAISVPSGGNPIDDL